MKVADASFFIALLRDNDAHHARANELIDQILQDKQSLIATTHVIEETVTYIFSQEGSEAAYRAVRLFLEAQNVRIETINSKDIEAAGDLVRKYKKFSLSDALSVWTAWKHEILEVVSFDSDFDHVERIRRIY